MINKLTSSQITEALENSGYGDCVYKAVRFSHFNKLGQAMYIVAWDSEEEEGEIELGFVFIEEKNGKYYGDF